MLTTVTVETIATVHLQAIGMTAAGLFGALLLHTIRHCSRPVDIVWRLGQVL